MKSFKKGCKHRTTDDCSSGYAGVLGSGASNRGYRYNENGGGDSGSGSVGAPTGEPPSDDFSARRSSRVAAGRYAADGDTWVEALAVCELPPNHGRGRRSGKKGRAIGSFRPKSTSRSSSTDSGSGNGDGGGDPYSAYSDYTLTLGREKSGMTEAEIADASDRLAIRPYFHSRNTGQKVWDEPPSGASNIVYATAEARRMAQAQLEELRGGYAQSSVFRRAERDGAKAERGKGSNGKRGGDGRGVGKSKSTSALLSKGKKMLGLSSGSLGRSGNGGYRGGGKRTSDKDSSGGGSDSSRSDKEDECSRTRHGGTHHHYRGGFINDGIPPSVLEKSIAQGAADPTVSGRDSNDERAMAPLERASAISDYEREMQMAMLMSMGIGGGSIMGFGGGGSTGTGADTDDPEILRAGRRERASTGEGQERSATAHGMTREEQDQFAMAKALSLSETDAPSREVNRNQSAEENKDRPRQRRHGSSRRKTDDKNRRRSNGTSENDSGVEFRESFGEASGTSPPKAPLPPHIIDDGGGKFSAATAPRRRHRREEPKPVAHGPAPVASAFDDPFAPVAAVFEFDGAAKAKATFGNC